MTDDMQTWRQLLKEELNRRDETLIACTLSGEELDVSFHAGYGLAEGKPFTAWGEKYVYFPVTYDGAAWVRSAPRNPCDEATEHVGGE